MILFVDGVDGSGKSTLIDQLLDRLAMDGTPAVHAPALWTFLSPLGAPEDFGSWVQETAGLEVARNLLAAMCRRVDKFRTDLAHGITSEHALIVADRGPKTITCSALAHAATGLEASEPSLDGRRSLSEGIDELHRRVTCLCANADVAVVELIHGTTDLVLDRLTLIENLTPTYERYLRVFCDQMATALPWPGIPWLALPAATDVGSNVAALGNWLARTSG